MKNQSEATHKTREQFHRKHRNFFVGLFILIPLVVLPVFLIYSLIKTSYLEKTWYLHVKYDNAAGLGKNAAVTILGIKVGYVESVVLNNAGCIDVTMKVKQDCMRLVKKDSRARLQQKNVAIGDWEIELTAGTHASAGAQNGDTLTGDVQAPIAKTLEQVNKTIDTFQKILQNILDGKGTVGRIMKEDTLVTIAQQIARNANSLVLHANTSLRQVDMILNKVGDIGEKGKQIADSVKELSGKIITLVTDVNGLVNGLNGATKDVPALMGKVQSDLSEVELLLKALQNNWLIKGSITGQKDPMLNEGH
jgi:ABC-type transport system involved in resistance to organic solvents, periplasmic component